MDDEEVANLSVDGLYKTLLGGSHDPLTIHIAEFAFGVGSPSTLRKPQAHPFISSLESRAGQSRARVDVSAVYQ